eukprot:COSAG01_NODE_44105_length_422_cov_1.532508_1_plen_56_part_01
MDLVRWYMYQWSVEAQVVDLEIVSQICLYGMQAYATVSLGSFTFINYKKAWTKLGY